MTREPRVAATGAATGCVRPLLVARLVARLGPTAARAHALAERKNANLKERVADDQRSSSALIGDCVALLKDHAAAIERLRSERDSARDEARKLRIGEEEAEAEEEEGEEGEDEAVAEARRAAKAQAKAAERPPERVR